MNIKTLLQLIGPGMVFAATSVGVSHVVQSTRAGADFGFALVGLIVFAHLVKLPFFQMGPRYAAITGESLLDAYRRQGKLAWGVAVIVTFCTMFIIQAAVSIVAAGVLANILPTGWSINIWSAVVMLSIIILLVSGGYRLLNSLIRWMMLIFAVTCLITLVGILLADLPEPGPVQTVYTSATSIAFMVALVGWMPTAIEVSVWHSFWVLEKKQSEDRATFEPLTTAEQGATRSSSMQATTNSVSNISEQLKRTVLDFNIGYVFCCVFAIVFVIFGAKLFFGQGQELSDSAIGFSAQLINIFTSVLGSWSQPFVSALIFIAMYSTCLAVADGFSQVMTRLAENQFSLSPTQHRHCYTAVIPFICFGGWLIIYQFSGQLKSLVDFATTVAFVSAPIFAWLNMRSMSLPNVPEDMRLQGAFKLYSWFCLLVLIGFALFFIYWFLF